MRIGGVGARRRWRKRRGGWRGFLRMIRILRAGHDRMRQSLRRARRFSVDLTSEGSNVRFHRGYGMRVFRHFLHYTHTIEKVLYATTSRTLQSSLRWSVIAASTPASRVYGMGYPSFFQISAHLPSPKNRRSSLSGDVAVSVDGRFTCQRHTTTRSTNGQTLCIGEGP